MNNIYIQLIDSQSVDASIVLATVTKSVGSTPQKPGSSAIFNLTGLLSGTVGGGVLEGEVQKIALKAIKSKESGYYNFKLDQDISQGEGAICGGQASILVDASPGDHRIVFEQVKQSLINRIPGVMVTKVTRNSNSTVRIQRYWLTENEDHKIPGDFGLKIAAEVRQLMLAENLFECRELNFPVTLEGHDVFFLLEPLFPPAHLVIAGAGHIGKALSHFGKLLDFEVTVIDDRIEYANPANLPEADHVINDEIGKVLEKLKKTSDVFVVIVTRGHVNDNKALKDCIGKGLAYVGMIGSKNKVTMMKKDFIRHGWATPEEWDKIHAPIGLDIKSQSVQEIAISIAAQLVLVKNCKKPPYV